MHDEEPIAGDTEPSPDGDAIQELVPTGDETVTAGDEMVTTGDEPPTPGGEAVSAEPSRRGLGWRPGPVVLLALVVLVVVAVVAVVASNGSDGSDGGSDAAATSGPRLPIALGVPVGAEAAADSQGVESLPGPYVLADGVPALGEDRHVHRVVGTVTDAQVTALATALGLDAPAERDGPSVRVVDGDRTLEITEGPGAPWWFGPTVAVAGGEPGGSDGSGCSAGPDGGCAEDSPGDTPVSTDASATVDASVPDAGYVPHPTVVPDPDPGIDSTPAEAEARAAALAVAVAAGAPPEAASIELAFVEQSVLVTLVPALDGAPSGLTFSVTAAVDGTVESATGSMVVLDDLGPYPVLSTQAALDRYQDGSGVVATDATSDESSSDGAGASGSSGASTGSAASPAPGGEAAPGERAPGDDPLPETEPVPGSEPLPSPVPGDDPVPTEVPEPEVIDPPQQSPSEVVLTGAESVWILSPAVDGSTDAYLVPGYRFTGEGGEILDVVAVADEAVAVPATTEPGAVTEPGAGTDPGAVPGSEPVPPGTEDPNVTGATEPAITPEEPCAVEGDATGTTHTVPCPPGG